MENLITVILGERGERNMFPRLVNLATRGGLDATLGGRTFLGAGDAASKASGASGMLGKAGQFLGSSAAIPIVGGVVSGVTGWLKARAMKQAEEVKARAALRAGDVEAQNELFNRQMVAQEQEKIRDVVEQRLAEDGEGYRGTG